MSPFSLASRRSGRPRDILAVSVDELADMFTTAASVGAGVFYGAAEPDIVADQMFSLRLSPQVIHVRLLHFEVP